MLAWGPNARTIRVEVKRVWLTTAHNRENRLHST